MSKKTLINKVNILKLLIIVLIISVIILCIIILFNRNNEGPDENIQEDLIVNSNSGGIDIKKLDNAQVVGNEKENISEKLLKDKEFEGLKITNISLKSTNGVSNFKASVTNDTGEEFKSKMLLLSFLDNNGNELSKMQIYIPNLNIDSTSNIDASITADIINAYNFTIENIE